MLKEGLQMESNLLFVAIALVLSWMCCMPFTSVFKAGYNYNYAKPLDHTKSNEWGFSMYFDDRYNFLDYPHLNSLFPQRELYDEFYSSDEGSKAVRPQSLPSLVEHWNNILVHSGINVYEPVYNFHKALFCDIAGFHPVKLRFLSIAMHTINAILLFHWLRYVIEWNTVGKREGSSLITSKKRKNLLPILLACVVFYVHPLNMEVVGWLSAQGYVFALFYALLALITTERFFFNLTHRTSPRKNVFDQLPHLVLVLMLYLFASWVSIPL